jgi:two-component system, chemotaxis family, sensor kinase CheA
VELSPDITPDDIEMFLVEADEQLELLDQSIVKLEHESDSDHLLQEIFRAAHTMKGSSAMLGFKEMTGLAHVMEQALDQLRNGEIGVTPELVDALLNGMDGLKDLRGVLSDMDQEIPDVSEAIAQLEDVVAGESGGAAPVELGIPSVREPEGGIDLDKLRGEMDKGNSVLSIQLAISSEPVWYAVKGFQVLTALQSMGEVITSAPTQEEIDAGNVGPRFSAALATEMTPESVADGVARRVEDITNIVVVPAFTPTGEPTEIEPAPAAANQGPAASGSSAQAPAGRKQALRIDVERIDAIINTIGELMVDRTRIAQIGRGLEKRYKGDDLIDALSMTSGHIVKLVDDLHEIALRVRMQPIGTALGSFPRMVRDLARQLDKQIEFSIEGGETEVDRTVVERIKDPLVHLIRNSIDHGIESPEDRKAAGKNPVGKLVLRAAQEHGSVVITVEDDGKGIDTERVKQAVVEKGMATQEMVDRLNTNEALDLIFLPGSSTKEETTEVSGRGVGMDIVRSNIESVNGSVNVATKVGKQTQFTLTLPLTLATVPSLLVDVAEVLYAIPLAYVIEIAWRRPDEVTDINHAEVVRVRDSIVPLVRLDKAFGAKSNMTKEDNVHIVVVQLGDRWYGLAVDTPIDTQDVVVKPLSGMVSGSKGISGSTVLGDGRVVLVVDVPALVSSVAQSSSDSGTSSGNDERELSLAG